MHRNNKLIHLIYYLIKCILATYFTSIIRAFIFEPAFMNRFSTKSIIRKRIPPKLRAVVLDIISLVKLVNCFRIYDQNTIQLSLSRLRRKLNIPSKAVLLLPLGICDVLFPFLTLNSKKNSEIVSLTLHCFSVIALFRQSYEYLVSIDNLCPILLQFLKSHHFEQKLAAQIVVNIFRQSPHNDTKLMQNIELQSLLLFTLRLPFCVSIQETLHVLDDITYHGDNVRALLENFGQDHDLCFLSLLEELLNCDFDDLQLSTLNIFLNCISFADTYPSIRSALLHHTLRLESHLIQVSQSRIIISVFFMLFT
jgi:hypothetical protein